MFLRAVVQDINAHNPTWDRMVIILPSNRSIRELRSVLSKELKTPIFSPKFLTIEEFIAEVSGLSLCNSFELQLELYEAFCKINPKSKEDFTSFTGWANSVLNDFNEIDRYLIPVKKIFDYLSAISSIKNWGPNESPNSFISEYTKFINGLGKLYATLNKSLSEKGLGYQGMLYRKAANNIGTYLKNNTATNFQIIGLNALNEAEKTILKKVLNVPLSNIYWDIDNFFLKDKHHSAGYFMRQNLSTFEGFGSKQKRLLTNNFLSQKKIQIVGVPKNISQTKYVGQLLKNINFNKGPATLVLADESLLPAVLNSIPEIGCEVNITMGYPIIASHTLKLLKCILTLKQTKNERAYYHKDVEELLSNPILSYLIDAENLTSFSEGLKQKNEVFIKKTKLQTLFQPNHLLLNAFIDKLVLHDLESYIDLLSSIIDGQKLKVNSIELESCISIVSGLKEIVNYLSKLSHKFSPKELEGLIENHLKQKTISFKGDPNKGLQIMGLLETRALDFDTVIMTSVNEGILPAGKSDNSFIPYDVKYEFGLPTIREKDAVYTYHFYRLLQRAKTVHLVYNTEPDVLKGGEPSRFIHQLTTDEHLKAYVQHDHSAPKIASSKSIDKRVEKTDLLVEHLKTLASNGFSPSSLAAYIRNPYDFYKEYVLGINTPQSIEEDVAYNVLGSIVHDSLEKLYQPLIGKSLSPQILNTIEANIRDVVFAEFEKHYSKNAILKGKNFILFEVVQKYVQSVISKDKFVSGHEYLKIIALEQKLNTSIKLANGTKAVLKGKLDRVDSLNGQLRVIDYKTGTVEKSGLNVTVFDDLFTNKKYEKAFQLLCYCLLYHQQEDKAPWQAAILPVKQINEGLIPLKVDKNTQVEAELIKKFRLGLISLIEEILNPNIPFIEKVD